MFSGTGSTVYRVLLLLLGALAIGIEVKPVAGANVSSGLIELGSGSATSGATQPHDITIDRCYIHGNPGEASKRGVEFNGKALAVIDSYLSEFKDNSVDTQAILG